MNRPNAHATRSKILTPNFVEGVISMMYLVLYMKFCMATSRDESILYDLTQLREDLQLSVSFISVIYYNLVILLRTFIN
jgi:hypothetical protein